MWRLRRTTSLKGIESQLDYIKSIGVNTIWISPVFSSEFFDGGYDVTDFYSVDKRYGTNSQLVSLVQKVHEKGMKIFMDLVAGHTSDKHPWFLQSKQADKNLQYSLFLSFLHILSGTSLQTA